MNIYRSEKAEKGLMEIYNHALLSWPVDYEETFIETRFGKTFAVVSGRKDADAIVLIHGSGANALTWGGDVAKYSGHFRAYALDIPGEPGRSAHTRLEWDSEAHNVWLDEVLSGLGIRSCIIAGISYGGWIALNYASSKPDRVSKLVLISTCDESSVRASYIWKLIFNSLLGDYGKERLKRMFFAGVPLPPDAKEFFDICSSSFVYRQGFPPKIPDEALSKLSMPLLYLASAKDQVFNAGSFASRLAENAFRADIRIIKDAGHVLVNTAGEVLSFLGKYA